MSGISVASDVNSKLTRVGNLSNLVALEAVPSLIATSVDKLGNMSVKETFDAEGTWLTSIMSSG